MRNLTASSSRVAHNSLLFTVLRSAATQLENARQTLATALMPWLNAAPTRASVVVQLNTTRMSSKALRASIAAQGILL